MKRDMLKKYYNIKTVNEDDTERAFRRMVFRKIKNNEKDLIHDIS